jgi:hypothetical protein
MNKHKIFLRLLVSPLVLALLSVTFAYHAIRMFGLYLWYGGEWITLARGDRKTIDELYQLLKEQNDAIKN